MCMRVVVGTALIVVRVSVNKGGDFMVRCKFTCLKKSTFPDGACSVEMQPVYNGSEENKKFFSATPSGQIYLGIINPVASKQFEEGKEYYIDISPAE